MNIKSFFAVTLASLLVLVLVVRPGQAQTLPSGRIAAGAYHTCAITGGGDVKCWGYNFWGQLGNGNNTNSFVPVEPGITAVKIVAGSSHTCALPGDGTVLCWGDNEFGQLGDTTTTDSNIPVQVSGISSAVDLFGGYRHNCALLADGTAQCWGLNTNGQLGNGSTTSPVTSPVVFGSYNDIISLGLGLGHSCALRSDNSVWCVGLGTFGQLGNGASSNSTSFVQVSGITTARTISALVYHTCVILQDGEARCWGYNNSGQLGDNTTSNRNTPITPTGLPSVLAISAGFYHSCAIAADLSTWCWGTNTNGQLGTDGSVSGSGPFSNGVTGLMEISAGSYHTAGLFADHNTVYTWGSNSYGQQGSDPISQLLLEPAAPTATPAPIPTPRYMEEVPLSSGNSLLLEKRFSYGEISVSLSLLVCLAVGIIGFSFYATRREGL